MARSSAILAGWFSAAAVGLLQFGCASTDNRQLEWIGAGRFPEVASLLEAKAAVHPLETADLHELCYAYSRIKRYAKLFACLDTLEARAANGDRQTRLFAYSDVTPVIRLMRAEAWLDFGRNAEASKAANEALEMVGRSLANDEDIEADALSIMTLAAAFAGDRPAAEAYLARLQKLERSWIANDPYASQKVYAFARCYLALGRYQQVLDTLTNDRRHSIQVLLDDLMTGARFEGSSNWVWQDLPRAYMIAKSLKELGRTAEAKAAYDRLLANPETAANGEIEWLVLYDRGRIAEAENDIAGAIDRYGRAVERFELQRASINTEANKIGFVGRRQEVYDRIIALLARSGQDRRAFEYVQREKARAFIDLLAQKFASPDRQPIATGTDGALGAYFKVELEGLEQSSASDGRERRRQANAQATAQLVAAAPNIASVVTGNPLKTPEEARRLLGPDETLVQYQVSGNDGWIWVISRDTFVKRPLDIRGLADLVKQFRLSVERPDRPVADKARELYDRLLRPVAGDLKTPGLLVVPDASLYYVPFVALSDGRQSVLDRFRVRFMPALSIYETPRRQDGATSMLVIGDPDTGVSVPLPDAAREATDVARLTAPDSKLLIRGGATRAAFAGLAGRYGRIHIASHAGFNAEQPLNSYVMLARDGRDNGYFTAQDFLSLKYSVDLITLSGCSTGLGGISPGKDVLGFNSALLRSGARNIVSSLWEVSDPATAGLMQSFYRNLPRGKREALRAAQIETRKTKAHPYYWASFYLTGFDP